MLAVGADGGARDQYTQRTRESDEGARDQYIQTIGELIELLPTCPVNFTAELRLVVNQPHGASSGQLPTFRKRLISTSLLYASLDPKTAPADASLRHQNLQTLAAEGADLEGYDDAYQLWQRVKYGSDDAAAAAAATAATDARMRPLALACSVGHPQDVRQLLELGARLGTPPQPTADASVEQQGTTCEATAHHNHHRSQRPRARMDPRLVATPLLAAAGRRKGAAAPIIRELLKHLEQHGLGQQQPRQQGSGSSDTATAAAAAGDPPLLPARAFYCGGRDALTLAAKAGDQQAFELLYGLWAGACRKRRHAERLAQALCTAAAACGSARNALGRITLSRARSFRWLEQEGGEAAAGRGDDSVGACGVREEQAEEGEGAGGGGCVGGCGVREQVAEEGAGRGGGGVGACGVRELADPQRIAALLQVCSVRVGAEANDVFVCALEELLPPKWAASEEGTKHCMRWARAMGEEARWSLKTDSCDYLSRGPEGFTVSRPRRTAWRGLQALAVHNSEVRTHYACMALDWALHGPKLQQQQQQDNAGGEAVVGAEYMEWYLRKGFDPNVCIEVRTGYPVRPLLAVAVNALHKRLAALHYAPSSTSVVQAMAVVEELVAAGAALPLPLATLQGYRVVTLQGITQQIVVPREDHPGDQERRYPLHGVTTLGGLRERYEALLGCALRGGAVDPAAVAPHLPRFRQAARLLLLLHHRASAQQRRQEQMQQEGTAAVAAAGDVAGGGWAGIGLLDRDSLLAVVTALARPLHVWLYALPPAPLSSPSPSI